MWEKVFGLSQWSLTLDASILFMQDVWNFYLYSGNKAFLSDYYPVLQKIVGYLETILDTEGLMKVKDIGLPNVWLDHFAFQEQHHKTCALNLLVSGCLKEYFHKIANVLDKFDDATRTLRLANKLLDVVQLKFWDDDAGIYVCNLPWVNDKSEYLYDEMSLSFALIFDLCPGNRVDQCLETLMARPSNLGRVFASNCNWVYTALAKFGQMQFVLNDLRDIWAVLPPVLLNNTLPECLDVQPDTVNEWSHSAVVPLFSLYEDILGIQALQLGFERIRICPQLCDIGSISVDCYIPQGKIIFDVVDTGEEYKITITIPKGCSGEFCIPKDDSVVFNKYDDSSSFDTKALVEGENKFVIKK